MAWTASSEFDSTCQQCTWFLQQRTSSGTSREVGLSQEANHGGLLRCWNCGASGNHYDRDCQQQTDASNPQVRRGASAVNMSLSGGGDVTTDQLGEQFGSVEEARSWVVAVYDATENWMAAIQ